MLSKVSWRTRRTLVLSLTFVLLAAFPASSLAQQTDAAPDAAGAQTAAEAEGGGQAPAEDAAAVPHGRLYMNPFWLALVIISVCFWLYLTSWLSDDAKGHGLDFMKYTAFMMGAGWLGLALALLIHAALAFLMLVLVMTVFCIYAAARNQRVPEQHKLFGPHHRAAMIASIPLISKIVQVTPRIKTVMPVLDLRHPAGRTIKQVSEEQPGLADAAGVLTEFIMRAGATKSSKIRIQPAAEQYVVQFILDGVLHNVEGLELELAQQVIFCAGDLTQLLKGGKLRKGSVALQADLPGTGDVPMVFHLSVAGGRPALAIDLPDWTAGIYKGGLEALGMHEAIIKRVKAAVDQGRGALLLCGPGGAGKTTSLLAAVGTVDVFTNDIMLIDKHGSQQIEQIRKTKIPTDRSFDEFFADVEREGPNVILFDEIETPEQAGHLLRFASGDGLLLSGISAPDAPEALVYLAKLAGSSDFVDRAATCVLSQRLIRKLCAACREEVEANPALLQKLGINPEEPGVWYRPVGCESCLGSGYMGRTALFGMLILTDPVKDALRAEGATPADIRRAAGKAAFRTMYQDGIAKVTAGITTLEEVRRVLKTEQG